MKGVRKPGLFDTQAGVDVLAQLQTMADDRNYITKSTYSANGELYPNHKMTFVERHKEFLRTHPTTDPQLYLSNLRLMHRKK